VLENQQGQKDKDRAMNPDAMSAFGTLSDEVAEAVATAEATSNNPRLMGMGIYLELPNGRGDQTTQILITPEGKNEKGEDVAMGVISRTVAEWSPRAQWRTSFIRPSAKTPEELALATHTSTATDFVEQIERILKRQMMYGLSTLRNKPIVFELTDVDYTDIADWKAPASALRRIQKARVALTFPEKLV
jgi:hypothetical protein